MVKLTAKSIEGLKTKGVRFTASVTGYPGLEIRISPTGEKVIYQAYTDTKTNKRRRYKIGRYGDITAQQVEKLRKSLLGRVADGEDPQVAKVEQRTDSQCPTLGAFIRGDYGEWCRTNQKSGDATINRLLAAFAELANKRLNEITTWDIERWRTTRLKKVSKLTANRDLTALRTVFNHAVTARHVSASPVKAVKSQRTSPYGRTRVLTATEEGRLREALAARDKRLKERQARYNDWRTVRHLSVIEGGDYGDHLTPLVLLALNTGIRRGELLALGWRDVDLKNRVVHVLEGKTDMQPRTVPLNAEAFDVLKSWRKQSRTALVFAYKGNPIKSIKTAWAKLLVEADITGFTFHDLRHCFASKLVERRQSLYTVAELLGHKDLKMTQRYAHLSDDHKRAAVEALTNG